MVEQPCPRGVLRLPRQRLLPRRDDDHREPSRPCLGRDLDGHRGQPVGTEDHHRVGRPKLEVREDHLGEALHPLDEHGLTLAVGADDLGVVRHRELDHRVEPGVRAVARKHLLHRDARVPGAEQVHEPASADRIRAETTGGFQRLRLRLCESGEELLRRFEPGRCRSPGHDRSAQAADESTRARAAGGTARLSRLDRREPTALPYRRQASPLLPRRPRALRQRDPAPPRAGRRLR